MEFGYDVMKFVKIGFVCFCVYGRYDGGDVIVKGFCFVM